MRRGTAVAGLFGLAIAARGDAWLHRAHTRVPSGRWAHDSGEGVDTPRPTRSRCQGARDDQALPDVLTFNLRSALFPGSDHPDVAVHVPEGFDGTNAPGLVVFFHGFENCVVNVLRDDDGACSPDGPVRDALHLSRQLDDARVNAILVAVEGRYDVAAGDPGQLSMPGNFRTLLHELMVEHLNEPLGCELDVDDFERVVVSSHSGGYQAVSALLQFGDVPVREVQLLDSLYGEMFVFDDWMKTKLARFDPDRDDAMRWVNVYTCCGGTSDNSRAMAIAVGSELAVVGLEPMLLADDTTAPLGPADLAKPIVFKQTDTTHADVPRAWFGVLVGASGFAPIR